jgi:hypothetical protein
MEVVRQWLEAKKIPWRIFSITIDSTLVADHGKYGLGRHYPVHPITAQIPAYVVWFGFYPWNERAIARKLQISDRIPIHDRVRGYSYHHQWNRDEQERQKEIWTSESLPCSEVKDLVSCLDNTILM